MSLYISNKKINTVHTGGGVTISDGLWSGSIIHRQFKAPSVPTIINRTSTTANYIVTNNGVQTASITKATFESGGPASIGTLVRGYNTTQILNYFGVNTGGETDKWTGTMDLTGVTGAVGTQFLYGNVGGNTPTFTVITDFVLNNTSTNFMSTGWSGRGGGYITLQLNKVQTITTAPTGFCSGTVSARIHLRIKSGSAAVNGNTWLGSTFASVTII